ncbi:MAG: response regulator transcription factor, partial [Acidobacteriota bacterium]
EKSEPAIVVMDYEMPDGDACDAIRDIKKLEAAPSVLVVTAHDASEVAVSCLRSGADGYLPKSATQEELNSALRQVRAGRKYVSSELTALLATRSTSQQASLSLLSDREREVLSRITGGQTVTEIAGEMDLSVKTISTYRTRLLRKLRCRTQADLLRFAIREDLLRP